MRRITLVACLSLLLPLNAVAIELGEIRWSKPGDAAAATTLLLDIEFYLDPGEDNRNIVIWKGAFESSTGREVTAMLTENGELTGRLLQRTTGERNATEFRRVSVQFRILLSDLSSRIEGMDKHYLFLDVFPIDGDGADPIFREQVPTPPRSLLPADFLLALIDEGQATVLRVDDAVRRLKMANAADDMESLKRILAPTFALTRGVPGGPARTDITIPVYFATSRARSTDPTEMFTAARGARVTYGKVIARISKKDLNRRFTSASVLPLGAIDLGDPVIAANIPRDGLASLFERSDSNDLLIYVHGYNNSFADAVQRTAQLRFELGFEGRVMAFSWPSTGELFSKRAAAALTLDPSLTSKVINGLRQPYLNDLAEAKRSFSNLATVIEEVKKWRATQSPKPKIHFLAHSMGNFVTVNAIKELAENGRLPTDAPLFENLVLMAPDVNVQLLKDNLGSLHKSAKHVTHYFSSNDCLVRISENINGDRRCGIRQVCFGDSIHDSITADKINPVACFGFLSQGGHLYYGESRAMVLDLKYLVVHGLLADKRSFHLQKESRTPDDVCIQVDVARFPLFGFR